MNQRNIGIYLIAKALGVNFESFQQDFNQRLIFQKIMYIAFQSKKIDDLSCQFGLYLRGPYSPELADIGFEITKSYKTLSSFSLNQYGKEIVKQFRDKLPTRIGCVFDQTIKKPLDIKILESFSTLLMLCNNLSLVDTNILKYKDNILEDFRRFKGQKFVGDKLLDELFGEVIEFRKPNSKH